MCQSGSFIVLVLWHLLSRPDFRSSDDRPIGAPGASEKRAAGARNCTTCAFLECRVKAVSLCDAYGKWILEANQSLNFRGGS